MPLTPKAIYKDYLNKDLDKPFAIELLLTLIDNTENINTRIESVEILDKIQIDDEKTFRFLEHLLISDLNEDIRSLTCKVLQNHYSDRALDPLIWALNHEKSLNCIKTIISAMTEIKTERSKSILTSKLKELHNKENLNFLNEILKRDISIYPIEDIGEILIGYYIISFLKTKFGYFKFKISDYGLIEELDLSNIERYSSDLNKLENFLEAILSLNHLKKSDLRFNHLTKIPIISNNSIEILDLSYNKILQLPDLSKLIELKILNLKSNRLRTLPETIGKILKLKTLNLRNNMLKNLPKSLSYITSLKILDLHGNKLTNLGFDFSPSISELELGWNSFVAIPNNIKSLTLLEKLGLGGNKIENLPNWIGLFSLLRELDLYDNKITTIPESIGLLNTLEKLNLRNNHLRSLPSSVRNLSSLKNLNLSWNKFTFLPEWIGSLSSLEELNLWGNQLATLPNSLSSLSSLKILDLNFNQIEELPAYLKEREKKNELIIKL
jgi:Leucine-rich repeat (LRR) protein